MGTVVQPNYQLWAKRYPEFGERVDQDLFTMYWNEASLFSRNDGGGPISDSNVQQVIMNMATAHIAHLNAPIENEAAPNAVGRVKSFTQGSITVDLEMKQPEGGTEDWWKQTRYGAAWWAATASVRTMDYVPGIRPVFDPYWFG
jgi:hypothetical protein